MAALTRSRSRSSLTLLWRASWVPTVAFAALHLLQALYVHLTSEGVRIRTMQFLAKYDNRY